MFKTFMQRPVLDRVVLASLIGGPVAGAIHGGYTQNLIVPGIVTGSMHGLFVGITWPVLLPVFSYLYFWRFLNRLTYYRNTSW